MSGRMRRSFVTQKMLYTRVKVMTDFSLKPPSFPIMSVLGVNKTASKSRTNAEACQRGGREVGIEHISAPRLHCPNALEQRK